MDWYEGMPKRKKERLEDMAKQALRYSWEDWRKYGIAVFAPEGCFVLDNIPKSWGGQMLSLFPTAKFIRISVDADAGKWCIPLYDWPKMRKTLSSLRFAAIADGMKAGLEQNYRALNIRDETAQHAFRRHLIPSEKKRIDEEEFAGYAAKMKQLWDIWQDRDYSTENFSGQFILANFLRVAQVGNAAIFSEEEKFIIDSLLIQEANKDATKEKSHESKRESRKSAS